MLGWKKNQSRVDPTIKKIVCAADKVQDLLNRVKALEIQVKQLQCSHDWRFNYAETTFMQRHVIREVCQECGHKRSRLWKYIPKKERKAYRVLHNIQFPESEEN